MIYIDLGAYRGRTIQKFKNSKHYKPEAKIYAFECNPHLSGFDYGPDVFTVNAAAWVKDEELSFYVSKFRPDRVQGSSVDSSKKTGKLDIAHPVTVQGIDFNKWLFMAVMGDVSSTTPEPVERDRVIVKMNIEGAEYKVLPHLINYGSIAFIDTLIIKWHWDRINIDKQKVHEPLKQRLREVPGLNLVQTYDWYNE